MTKTIDKTEALALLVRAVAEKGENYIDTGLGGATHGYFADSGKPSCGVGLALSYVGMTKSLVSTAGANMSDVPKLRSKAAHLLPFVLTNEAVAVLEQFRKEQDHLKPWGEALAKAARV